LRKFLHFMASYHTRSKSVRVRPPTPTDGQPTTPVGMTESVGGPESMPTEQAGPVFTPSSEGRSVPGGEPGLEGSVGPLCTAVIDPEAPGRYTDPRQPQEAFQVPTALGITESAASQSTEQNTESTPESRHQITTQDDPTSRIPTLMQYMLGP